MEFLEHGLLGGADFGLQRGHIAFACQWRRFCFTTSAMKFLLRFLALLFAASLVVSAGEISAPADSKSFAQRLREANTLKLIYIGEGLANVHGGIRRGTVYDGVLEADWTFDLGAVNWKSATLFVSALCPHGPSLTQKYVGDFNVASNIDAYDTVRLYQAYIEQTFADGSASVRIGKIGLDVEFAVCDSTSVFVNSDFGTPATITQIAGLPIWPLATPGIRIGFEHKEWFLRTGVFSGNAGGENITNKRGTRFSLSQDNGVIVIGETGWQQTPKENEPGFRSAYKLGAFYHTGKFDDVGGGASHNGNCGVYGVADQQVLRTCCCEKNCGLSIFGRASAAPDDRNEAAWDLTGGLSYVGPLRGREDDVLGLGVCYTKISDEFFQPGVAEPTHHETVLELTYAAVLNEHLTVQPELQYIVNPGAVERARDAIVAGLRFKAEF
jgi:porin